MFRHALEQTLMISAFVLAMMMLVEFINVLTGGWVRERLARQGWRQYLLAAALGAMPGCLGAYTAVALYGHGAFSLGALAAAMIATSGDEAFVLFAMIPRQALLLTSALALLGFAVGSLTDRLLPAKLRAWPGQCEELAVHEKADRCACWPGRQIFDNFRPLSFQRALLLGGTLLIILAVVLGTGHGHGHGHDHGWGWERTSFLVVAILVLGILAVVPEHFLEEHLWRHVALRHLPPVFLWTFGALLLLQILGDPASGGLLARASATSLGLTAALLGLIPESGPHLVFVTGYANGLMPLSALVISSIVQDGHGMLPLLAQSRRAFLLVKGVNLLAGAAVGVILILLGN